MKEYSIKVKNISKSYNSLKAVDSLDFEVEKSTCFGILGPNGAGKTTVMKMLTGKGIRDKNKDSSIDVFGYDPERNELDIKFFSGIVPQEDNLDTELNVFQNLHIYSKFYDIKYKIAKQKINELLNFMELGNKVKSKIRHLSGGMQRRLVIVRALLNNPKLLILDEPTTGLDPQVRHIIWDKLRLLKKQGVTILLTTHYMEEAYQLCDKIILMNNGKKVLEGNPVMLVKNNIEKYVLEIFNPNKKQVIKKTNGIRIDKSENRIYLFSNELNQLDNYSKKLSVGDYYLRQSNLEDLFLRTPGRGLNE
jgi:lipooligosaccharide transport system ATP-binding protein